MSVLEKINNHDDLILLSDSERELLCKEIRDFLVKSVSATGGHLASNLGTVELSVAIETVFDTRKDRLVFDVGHQSYVHKILTGRREEFAALRQFGGIAGFPKPGESDADAFVAGHASSSVSIALGMARARTLQQQTYQVVALFGDGAATGGMIYEGLNDAAVSKEPMVLILNDNEMSIDRNVGGLASHLSRLRTKRGYLGFKQWYRTFLSKLPGGKAVYRLTSKLKDRIKRFLLPTTIFDNMGLTYLGPVDGHDLDALLELLETAKNLCEPVLVHILTRKGQGYGPAEEDPALFHGIGRFDPATGLPLKKKAESFSDAFGAALCDLAQVDPKLCAITAAMPGGTGLLEFQKKFPNRFFDVGIAEEHAVSMAGGLAKQGMIPVVALYSTFLQRSYDQIIQDVAMQNLHVVFAVDRAGLVGEDGETHHGIFDVGFLRQIPNMTVLCPGNLAELRQMLSWAVEKCTGPVAVRYPRGGDSEFQDSHWDSERRAVLCKPGSDVMLITYGNLMQNVGKAAELLEKDGISTGVIRLVGVEPIPMQELAELLTGCTAAVVIEEVCADSGISKDFAYELRTVCPACQVVGLDLGKRFITHGNMDMLYNHYGLDPDGIAKFTREVLKG